MYGTYLPSKPKRALVLGSGALQIGQAGEFDYSGSQAIKALKEEGIFTVLINPNIATVQTNQDFADRVYLVAINPGNVERIIVQESIDAIFLGFGGQTALNCALELEDNGVFEGNGVRVMGTPTSTIRITEDRELFVDSLDEIDIKTAKSMACSTLEEARQAALNIGLPVMLRAAFSLGGRGSGIVDNEEELNDALKRAFDGSVKQVLVEECLRGWKEIEYEVVRDGRDNCITVCNMENLDPLGIHTGESIVVAPSQTLNDEEYQFLRSVAIKTIRHLGVIGECNIQYALDPRSLDYRVIEVNARLSRSSALASKATGYPLAYVAAKLAIGYSLIEIPNGITRRTTCLFEPSLDYIVCKFPRWDLTKFEGASTIIGSEMKSVGEVMSIGRNFSEAIQKAARMLEIGVNGLDYNAFDFDGSLSDACLPTPLRIFGLANTLSKGAPVAEIAEITGIDRWFLVQVERIVKTQIELECCESLTSQVLLNAKKLGFSDMGIAKAAGVCESDIRERRNDFDIHPHFAQIDTLAAEFPAETNYLYSSYLASEDESTPSRAKTVLILGSGSYRIGSSVEFDWSTVNAVQASSELGYETILLNYNPETVSTDFDICDKLIFDEVSLESVLEVYERERPDGVILCMGGQTPNNLAIKLHEAGVKVLGTHPESIDRAEDRSKFSSLLDELGIDQPKWFNLINPEDADAAVQRLGGYPVIVRPSYVLSGAAMSVAHEPHELTRILDRAQSVSREHPVVVSKFETHAREIEIDAVADSGEMILWAISEHIEDAGVHSGDATLVLPPQNLYIGTIRRVRQIATQIARALDITGPFNIQFLAKHNAVKVIECNLRASRSLPFVSKITGNNFAKQATQRMLGVAIPLENRNLDLNYVGVKAPMFSFSRLVGADPMLGVEMRSTGEVGCIGADIHEALLQSLFATGFKVPEAGILLSLGPLEDKFWFTDEARVICDDLGLPIFATEGTAEMLASVGIPCTSVSKARDGTEPTALSLIEDGSVDLVINVPRTYDDLGRPDGYQIRRRAIDTRTPLITDRQLARAVIEALKATGGRELPLLPSVDYLSVTETDYNRH